MATTSNTQAQKYHPKHRRKVLAIADTLLQQIRVIDSKGAERNLCVYQCGPDIFYADTMDGIFDRDLRKIAPTWLVEQMAGVPAERNFDCFGVAKSARTVTDRTGPSDDLPAPEKKTTPARPKDLDEDAPSFRST